LIVISIYYSLLQSVQPSSCGANSLPLLRNKQPLRFAKKSLELNALALEGSILKISLVTVQKVSSPKLLRHFDYKLHRWARKHQGILSFGIQSTTLKY
jgi:hypothetical protein